MKGGEPDCNSLCIHTHMNIILK